MTPLDKLLQQIWSETEPKNEQKFSKFGFKMCYFEIIQHLQQRYSISVISLHDFVKMMQYFIDICLNVINNLVLNIK